MDKHDCKAMKAEIGKAIQRGIRADLRRWKKSLLAERIEAFSDLKSMAGIRKLGKRKNLKGVVDASGVVVDYKQGIVD
eukprot:11881811-Karenia_brevis.AAC.1